jgi:F-box-like
MDRVPVDILLHIFFIAAQTIEIASIDHQNIQTYSLSTVSQTWRSVSLQCPALWSSFSIQQTSAESTKEQVENALRWFHVPNSITHPLTLHAHVASEEQDLRPLSTLLHRYQARWKEIKLDITDGPGEVADFVLSFLLILY